MTDREQFEIADGNEESQKSLKGVKYVTYQTTLVELKHSSRGLQFVNLLSHSLRLIRVGLDLPLVLLRTENSFQQYRQ